jgi:hypothetical protein
MRRSLGWFLVGVCLLFAAGAAFAVSEDEPYQKIQVTFSSPSAMKDLLANPNIQLMDRGEGNEVTVLSRPSVTADLIAKGFRVLVIQPDLEAYYSARQGAALDYGVWHTYQETVDEMNLLHSQYPNLTTAPISLGTSHEGRAIWAMKISDNPNVQENEPEVLYDGMTHAREIMTVEVILYFMRYLCENYGTDSVCKFLVDNRQTWFVPLLNVDGFAYNELTNPNGGGMWRKNRRPPTSGCYGVDNNRNYTYQWVGTGSSTNPCDETYRGPSAGSEPENQAIMAFVNAHHFITHNSWHSVAGLELIPWSYTTTHTSDDALFRQIGNEMASENGYSVGQAPELLYVVNGGMTDWMYGATTEHPKIYSFSTEVGGSDFWPQQSERDGLIAENLHSIIYTTMIAGPAVNVTNLAISGGDGNGRIDPGETLDLLATVRNDGVLSDLTGLTVRLRSDDPYITMLDASNAVGTLGAGQSWTNTADPFNIRCEASCPAGRQVTFTVVADAAGGIHMEAPFVFTVGQLPVVYSQTFETTNDWVQDGTHTAVTGAFVCDDPVATPAYQPGDDTTPAPGVKCLYTATNPGGVEGTDDVDSGIAATHSPDLNLSTLANARLSLNYFFGQRDAGDDATGDFFKIDVSSNAGGNWVNLLQIGDVTRLGTWANLTVNLGDYITLTNQVRFRVQCADAAPANDICEGGIDDVYIYNAGSPNLAPSAPTALAPPDQGNVASNVTLVVGNATDPESDPLTYGFRVYSDFDMTNLVASADGIAQGPTTTSWQLNPPLPLGTYYWRAFATDAGQRGLYSASRSFNVTQTVDVADLTQNSMTAVFAEPNPARGGVQIRYMVPATYASRLAIYDPQGRVVRNLQTVPSATGWHELTWDGKDDAGRTVASGNYWVRLWTPGETRTVRVVRIQ